MESSVKYVDFSAIHLSGAETKLLREVCGKPQKRKTGNVTEEAERLEGLGLIEVYENAEKGRQGLFATALGKAYAEYAAKARRARLLDLVKWIVPLIISVAALILAVTARGAGNRAAVRTGTPTQSYQQTVTPSPASTPAAGAQTQPQNPAQNQTQPQAAGGASGEASGGASGAPG